MQTDDKDLLLLGKRLIDCSRTAYERGYAVYTEFLSLAEADVLNTLPKKELYTPYIFFGGYPTAERQMAVFLPDALCLRKDVFPGNDGEDADGLYAFFPITTLMIEQADRRFSDKMNHRDVLGSIMGTGIKRSVIGDIIISEDGKAYVFVCDKIAEYLMQELTNVGRQTVSVFAADPKEAHAALRFETINISLASVRLDSLISSAFSMSRTKAVPFVEGGLVYVNGKMTVQPSFHPKEGDVISVRGKGKFVFDGAGGVSRKNRQFVTLRKYI